MNIRNYMEKLTNYSTRALTIGMLKNFKLKPGSKYYMYYREASTFKEFKITILENYDTWILVDNGYYKYTIFKADLNRNKVLLSRDRILGISKISDSSNKYTKKLTEKDKKQDKQKIKTSVSEIRMGFTKAGIKEGVI